jgi:hypothetical protein
MWLVGSTVKEYLQSLFELIMCCFSWYKFSFLHEEVHFRRLIKDSYKMKLFLLIIFSLVIFQKEKIFIPYRFTIVIPEEFSAYFKQQGKLIKDLIWLCTHAIFCVVRHVFPYYDQSRSIFVNLISFKLPYARMLHLFFFNAHYVLERNILFFHKN